MRGISFEMPVVPPESCKNATCSLARVFSVFWMTPGTNSSASSSSVSGVSGSATSIATGGSREFLRSSAATSSCSAMKSAPGVSEENTCAAASVRVAKCTSSVVRCCGRQNTGSAAAQKIPSRYTRYSAVLPSCSSTRSPGCTPAFTRRAAAARPAASSSP